MDVTGNDPIVGEGMDEKEQPQGEIEARSKGWKPKEEYQGDPSKWVDAEEFVKREPLYQELHKLSKAIKKRDKELEAVVKYSKQQAEIAYKKGVSDLQYQLDEAVERGDKATVRSVTKELQELQPPPVVEESLPPEVVEFQEKHSWFDKDDEMTDYAVARAKRYANNNPEWSLGKRLMEVEKDVMKAFPDNFPKDRREIPSAVEGGRGSSGGTSSGNRKYVTNKLNTEEKLVYEQMVVRQKMCTHEEYFKSLEQAGREF